MKEIKRVLITPLDWGLGHATRIIPIVRKLQDKNIEVLLATNGRPYELLKREFPNLKVLRLSSYNIKYYANSIILNVATQIFKFFRAVVMEHRQVKKWVNEHEIDAIISDNRFGCYTAKTYNVFISHQLNLIVGVGLLEKWTNKFNHFYIRKFDECWIPDFEGEPNLSGKLSRPANFNDVKYLGAMSRIQPLDLEKKYDVSFVLSGPEPQRTRLEKIILNQAKDLKYKMMLVQGKPELDEEQAINENLHIKSYMSGEELSSLMTSSELIVCRSGYSTIMDLVVLGKKALLIPTPGQTEQEFLADYYKEQGLAHFVTQAKLDLKNDIVQALEVKGFGIFDGSSNNLDKALEGFLEKIS